MSRSSARKNPFHQKRALLGVEKLEDRALPSCTVISGFVYHDVNKDGLFQPQTESPIALSTIKLYNAQNVEVGATETDINGFYKFEYDESKQATDETLTKVVTFPTTETNYTLDRLLDQFDPNLGELQSIEITHAGSITSEIKVENVSTISESDISGTVSGTLTLTGPGGFSNVLNISGQAGSFHADQYDNITDFAGTSGGSFGEKTASDSDTITITGSAMDAYKGTGTVTLSSLGVATSNATGGGNIDAQIRSKGASTVTVTYHYKKLPCLEEGDYKIIQTAQPPTFFDGKESKDGTVIPNTIGTDFINVTVTDLDDELENNNFGELKSTQISGHVWYDKHFDGVLEANEELIPDVVIALTGPNGTTTKTTDANGYYEFTDLDPGVYTVTETQPGDYLDGIDNAGAPGGGTVVNDPLADQITTITLAAGDDSQNNDFGEIKPASLAGHVYYDADNDGVFDANETPIKDATVTLTGFDDEGPVNKSMLTNLLGEYKFDNLRPGTYAITESQPLDYDDGKDTIGTPGGTPDNDVFSGIDLQAGVDGVDNDFGEILPDRPGEPLTKNVGPFGQMPIVSKVQLTTVPWAIDAMDPVVRGQLAFVVATSVTLANHQPTTLEAITAANQLKAGASTAAIVDQLWTSDAHRALQAESIYQNVLDRAPTAAEKADTIQSLHNGKTELEVKEELFVSLEYSQLHPTTVQLAEALSADILNVIPGTAGTQNLLLSMANEPLNDVVHNLLTSDASLANMIDDAYHQVLRRPATTSEIGTWTTPLKNGTLTIDELTIKLFNTQEFFQLAFANVR